MIALFLKRIINYMNPFAMVKMFTNHAKVSIQNDRELDLCDSIDTLAEVSIKGIQKHSLPISHLALAELLNRRLDYFYRLLKALPTSIRMPRLNLSELPIRSVIPFSICISALTLFLIRL